MKSYTLCILALVTSFSTFASDIYGLNSEQINDLNTCLKNRNLSYEEVNQWKNQFESIYFINKEKPLIHNFNQLDNDSFVLSKRNVDNTIFVSGTFDIRGRHSFKNTIISNVTFNGEYDQLDLTGACLVNVRFKNSNPDMMEQKINTEASYSKNITLD